MFTKQEFVSKLKKILIRITTGVVILLVAGLSMFPLAYMTRYLVDLIVTDKEMASYLIIAIPVSWFLWLFFNLEKIVDYLLNEKGGI